MALFIRIQVAVLAVAIVALLVTDLVERCDPPTHTSTHPNGPPPESPPESTKPPTKPPPICDGRQCASPGQCMTCDWLGVQVCPGEHCKNQCEDGRLCEAPTNACFRCPGGDRCAPGGTRELFDCADPGSLSRTPRTPR